ncbi:MAG: lipase family protein, partial [Planctomycetes bacterium]|nr:lipase family protein [Planctomycetota bacterium]
VLAAIPICFGILFFPTETRDPVDVKPDPAPLATTTLLARLREPWSSLNSERLPAAVDLVRCAAAAYQTREQLKESVPELGFAGHVVVEDGPSKGLVLVSGTEAVIAFEGTNGVDDIGDWFANLDTAQSSIAEGAVHRGFVDHYNRVAGQVLEALEEAGIGHVWITGHSLGGAMAVLCAADVERRGKIVVRGVVTFGQPLLLVPACARVINEKLAGRHLRFINEADVVPCVAPGFRGGGSFVWFQDGKPTFGGPTMRAFAADEASALQDNAAEEGPAPLTPSEFEAKKRQVKAQFGPRPSEEQVKAQAIPSTTDHNMQRYVDAVRTHYGTAAKGR